MEKVRHPEISVIVPVYNVEPYLRCCLDSILAQTFTNFELILVDDGSTDNCGAICDEYALIDGRISVIHQKNGGLSAARNTGIDWVLNNSTSEWIAFIDSDDAVHLTYLECLYYATTDDVGLVYVYPLAFEDDKEIRKYEPVLRNTEILSSRDACMRMYSGDDMYLLSAASKLYNRKLFHNHRFPIGKINEDQHLCPKLLYLSEKVKILHIRLYFYRQREGSIIHSPFSLRRFDVVEALESNITFFKDRKEMDIYKLIINQKNNQLASCVIKAWEQGIYDDIPPKYKLPIWKASWIILVDTLRRGGLRFVRQRIGNLLRRYLHK